MLGKDKRAHPRVGAEVEVKYRCPAAGIYAYRAAPLENISRGGIFLLTEDPLPMDSQVELEFLIQSGIPSFRAEARVRWQRDRFKPHGIGLEFIDFSDEARSRFEYWIDHLL